MPRVIALVLATAAVGALGVPTVSATPPVAGFIPESYWNKPLPQDAPRDPDSDRIIDFLVADNGKPHLTLAGTSASGSWGTPYYEAGPGDPVYDVIQTRYTLPPEFDALRIPRGAAPDPTPDAELVIYDRERGYVAALHRAEYDAEADTWSAGGAALYYLGSNGLEGRVPGTDEPRNFGHRGVPPPAWAVRWEDVQRGSIDRVLKIAVDTTRDRFVYPMMGHESGTSDPAAPPEGARIRIKPGVDLDALGLSPAARVIAEALQRYGAVIGDQSGGNAVLKVENTVAEGRGHLWKGVLGPDALAAIPLRDFEVVRHGFEPPPFPLPPGDATAISLEGALEGVRGTTVTLRARLASGSGSPIEGRPVRFWVGDSVTADAVTDAQGVAAAAVTLDLPAGEHPVEVSFPGDGAWDPSAAAGSFRVLWSDVFHDATGGGTVFVNVPTDEVRVLLPAADTGVITDSGVRRVPLLGTELLLVTLEREELRVHGELERSTGAFSVSGLLYGRPFVLASP